MNPPYIVTLNEESLPTIHSYDQHNEVYVPVEIYVERKDVALKLVDALNHYSDVLGCGALDE